LGCYRKGAKVSDYYIYCHDENGKELCTPFKYGMQLKLKSKITLGKNKGLWEVIHTDTNENNIVNVVLRKVSK
jgi:hypothetical protein